jgi:hypothetical protein
MLLLSANAVTYRRRGCGVCHLRLCWMHLIPFNLQTLGELIAGTLDSTTAEPSQLPIRLPLQLSGWQTARLPDTHQLVNRCLPMLIHPAATN